MKLNIISHDDGYDSSIDVMIFIKMLQKHFRNKCEIEYFNYFDERNMKCANINVIVGFINNLHLKYAGVNIYLPQINVWNDDWEHYMPRFDYFFAKNERTVKFLHKHNIPSKKIINIGWCGIDRLLLPSDIASTNDIPPVISGELTEEMKIDQIAIKRPKSYLHWLAYIGVSEDRNAVFLLRWWWEASKKNIENMPQLHMVIKEKYLNYIINKVGDGFTLSDIPETVTIYKKVLKIEEHQNLLNWCGIHLCLHDNGIADSTLLDAMSVKSVVLTTTHPATHYYIEDEKVGYLLEWNKLPPKSKRSDKKEYLQFDKNEFSDKFNIIWNECKSNNDSKLVKMGELARKAYLKYKKDFDNTFKNQINELFIGGDIQDKMTNYTNYIKGHSEGKFILSDDKLPKISVVTLLYNRQNMFKLAMYNWVNTSYPARKVEWIIVDDSNNLDEVIKNNWKEIEDQLPKNPEKLNINYIKLDSKHSIGEKRNIGVSAAKNDIILFMDDDDYYPYNSYKSRVCHLISENSRNSEIECVVSTSLRCFHINKIISFMNVPPFELPLSKRTSEACMAFYKRFWDVRHFEDISEAEGVPFLTGRENQLTELESEHVIISLLHSRNSGGKQIPEGESNGCHYGWSDKFYLFITGLDK